MPTPRRLHFPEDELHHSSNRKGSYQRSPSPRGPPTPPRVSEAPVQASPNCMQSPLKDDGQARVGRSTSPNKRGVPSAAGTGGVDKSASRERIVQSYYEYFSRRRASMRTYLSYVGEVESRWRSQLPYWTDSPEEEDAQGDDAFSFPLSPTASAAPSPGTVQQQQHKVGASRCVLSAPASRQGGVPSMLVAPWQNGSTSTTWPEVERSWSPSQQSASRGIGSPTQAALSGDLPRLLDTIATTSSVETRVTSLRALARMCQPPGWHADEVDRKLNGGQGQHLWCSRGEHLAQLGGVSVLVGFLQPSNQQPDEVRMAACWAIRAAAAASDRAAAAAIDSGVVELILGLLPDSCNPDLLEAATWALFEVSAGSDYVITNAVNTGVIAALVGVLEQATDRPELPAYQQAAAAACWLLYGLGVAGEETGITLGVEASTEPAVALLQTRPNHELCSAVVALLSILADSCDANSVRIVRANAMPSLLWLAGSLGGDVALAERAAAVMCKLIAGEGGRMHAVKAGSIPVFLRLLNIAPRCCAGWLGLSEMTRTSAGARELLAVEGSVAFVAAKAHQLGVREGCGRPSRHVPSFATAAAAQQQELTELSTLCVQVLRHISKEEQGVQQLLACGAVGALIDLLCSSWRCAAEQSAMTLWNLAHDGGRAGGGGQGALAEQPGAIAALLHGAQTGPVLGRECAAETVRLLCNRHAHLLEEMWAEGGVPIMMSILEGRMSPKLVESACRNLQLLSCNPLARADVAAHCCEDTLQCCLVAFPGTPGLRQILRDTVQAVREAKGHAGHRHRPAAAS
mmetsp:Transcript_15836/g.44307  ORF Transcript_15836/g.44307 Transcript_15836/m.44307 type:complete len:801 (+) Transcript_15836:356-2758(+)